MDSVIVELFFGQNKSCLDIRKKVFVQGQGVPEDIEIDEHEDRCVHFLLSLNGQKVSTGRLRKINDEFIKFERIATLKEFRGYGIGAKLMCHMHEYCLKKFPEYLPIMHAQESAVGFYKKLGWTQMGDKFYEAGIAHYKMVFNNK